MAPDIASPNSENAVAVLAIFVRKLPAGATSVCPETPNSEKEHICTGELDAKDAFPGGSFTL
jgi:hypothetical protein